MSSLNKVMLIGRLGRDPELRYSQSGVAMLSLSIATDESYTDKQGERQARTEWHTIVCYQRLAEICAQYLSKGSLVYVEGSLATRKWQDKNEVDRYSTEVKAQTVQFLDRKNDQNGQKSQAPGRDNGNRQSAPSPDDSAIDGLPF